MIRTLLSVSAVCFAILSVAVAADVEIVARQVAVQDYCAWPNITKLPDGTLAAVVFNKPSHGKLEGEVECWTSRDGEAWTKAGVPAMHKPLTNWMNVACGLNRRGELVVVSSGWTHKKNDDGTLALDQTRRAYSAASADGGRTWTTHLDAAPPRPEKATEYIPFGDVLPADDGSLRVSFYTRHDDPRYYHSWMFRSDDDGKSWTMYAPIAKDHSETTLFHLGGKQWLAAARRQLGGTPTDLYRSDDDGKTWTLAADMIGQAAQHPADLLRLADGRLLISLGVRTKEKYGVGIRLSGDDGATWGPVLTLVDDCTNQDCGYPASVQLADGTIVTGFYARGTPQYAGYQFATVIWKAPSMEVDPELKLLLGSWQIVDLVEEGRPRPDRAKGRMRFVEKAFNLDDITYIYKIQVNSATAPKHLDLFMFHLTQEAIYKFEEDRLVVCIARPRTPRPTTFETNAGDGRSLITCKRTMPQSEWEKLPVSQVEPEITAQLDEFTAILQTQGLLGFVEQCTPPEAQKKLTAEQRERIKSRPAAQVNGLLQVMKAAQRVVPKLNEDRSQAAFDLTGFDIPDEGPNRIIQTLKLQKINGKWCFLER